MKPSTGSTPSFNYMTLPEETRGSVKTKTTEIKILVKQTAQGIIEIGQRLIEIKESLGYGNWLPWLEAEFGWSDTTAKRFIQTADKLGNRAPVHDLDIAPKALYLLAQNNTPEPVRQEAIERSETGEKITPKLAKEIKDRENRIKELEGKLTEKTTPNLDNLISGLAFLLSRGDITKRIALNYSQLPKADQEAALSNEKSRITLLKDLERLEAEKLTLAESATKAHEKADTMQAKFDEAVNQTTQEILKAKDKEIEQAKKEIAQAKVEIREQLESKIRETVNREYQGDLIKTRKEKEKALREKSTYQEKNSAMAKSLTEKDRKIKKLEDQIEVDSPTNIDNSRALKMSSLLKELEWNIADIKKEVKIVGGEMQETRQVVSGMMEALAELLGNLEEQAVIDI
ncbi:MAG: DUF3102 domain-containing protein [Desulfobulbaceae bacterium]|nr:DUF3102 domain-containing protein [Desulfobulbaceae bacterium]